MSGLSVMSKVFNYGIRISRNGHKHQKRHFSELHDKSKELRMEKCLLVSKVTRLEYERNRHRVLSPAELELALRRRGSDYDALLAYHTQQKEFESRTVESLLDMGVDVKVASRLSYSADLIDWCDFVLPCGGDGTFLLAASQVRDIKKPVIGLNSAPDRSVGRLCLPKWCSKDIKGALNNLKEGRYKWMYRTRIRTTVTTDRQSNSQINPISLHTPQLSRFEMSCQGYESENISPPEYMECQMSHSDTKDRVTSVIPVLALNEVFIGESVSARVSHLQLTVDEGKKSPTTKTKSSGLCVTTGTGSTSWHLSINCLRTQSVEELLKIFATEYGLKVDTSTERARLITERYNNTLIFPPDSPRLAYSVREYITSEDWPTPTGLRARDFASSVRVKSQCVDAGLVIDGGLSFPFNDGTEAFLEIRPEDSLRTVTMDE